MPQTRPCRLTSLREAMVAVYDRLDFLDTLASEGDLHSRAVLSSTEIVRLTSGWRALLAAHQPNSNGRCLSVLDSGSPPAPHCR